MVGLAVRIKTNNHRSKMITLGIPFLQIEVLSPQLQPNTESKLKYMHLYTCIINTRHKQDSQVSSPDISAALTGDP